MCRHSRDPLAACIWTTRGHPSPFGDNLSATYSEARGRMKGSKLGDQHFR